ncbi:MAG: restriction endonuclease subunit [Firmicutes bacterium]|nr:restriction endonuclease subunit [Bacillota bacterium]
MTAQDLKNSILQLAIQGKLVEQRAKEGTAKELLELIKAEKDQLIKEKKIKKEKPLPEISEEEIPFEIPESWEWVKLGEVVSVNGGKRIPVGKSLTDEDTGYKYIRVADMKNGSIALHSIKYITADVYLKIKNYTISKDDVYITVAGTIGQVGLVPEELDNANLTENADKLVIYSNFKEFMYYMLSSNFIQYQIKEYTTKVGQPKLAIKRIKELIIPLPPLEEQKRIVAKIEEIMPYVDKYDKAYKEVEELNKKFPEDMQKSILQYAIQGKLVDQRKEEGTAEELYQQIQSEKEKLIKEGKIKKEKPLGEIIDDEILFEIPKNWKLVKLFDILLLKPTNGYSPKGVSYETKIKNLTLTATTSGIFNKNAYKYVDIDIDDNSPYWLKHNDLLIQRSNSREYVGTSCIYDGLDNEFIYPDLIMRMKIHPIILVEYINYVLKSPFSRKYFKENATGTSESMPKINQNVVSNAIIPLPPLEEQKRIVAKIEELLPYIKQLLK